MPTMAKEYLEEEVNINWPNINCPFPRQRETAKSQAAKKYLFFHASAADYTEKQS